MSTYREIVRLVWPLALGMINNAVMQFVDRAYLAHDSMCALEAVLPAGMLMWLFAGFFQSVVGYSSVFVGQYHGAGQSAKCRSVLRAAMGLSVLSGVLSLPLLPLGIWILQGTGGTPERLMLETSYFRIMMMGAFFVYGQMAVSSYFTGRGQTRIVFWVNLLGNVLNVILDPILIFTCGLGIAGAAYATVAATAVQWLVLMGAALRERKNRSESFAPVEVWANVRQILRYGVPAGVYTVFNNLSFMIFVFVTGGVGEVELAVSNACFTVNYLLFAPMEGFSLGASTLVAQAIGRGDVEDAARAARRTIALGVGFVACLSVVTVLCSRPILSIFSSDPAFQALGRTLFLLMSAWLVFDGAETILSGALKGAGDTRFVMTWMLVCAFVVWMPLVFVVRHVNNTMPLLWSTVVVYVIILFVGSSARWYFGRWRNLHILEA